MARNFKEALRHRRTYYHITNSSPISDEQIKEIIDFAVMNVPSAFNSQSTRIVLLLGKNHKRLWEITKETLKRLVSAEVFKGTEAKIDGSLAAGYGTILFRRQSGSRTVARLLPYLLRQISGLGTANIRHAPAGYLDNARRYRLRRVPSTL